MALPGTVTTDEFKALEARVKVLENETDRGRRVTRHILEQTRLNGDDLAAIKTRMGRAESEVHSLKTAFGQFR